MLRSFANVIQKALDIILPRKDRVIRLEEYSLEDIPLEPREHEACGVQITTLLSYGEPAVNDLVRALKYDRSGKASKLLSAVLAEFLLDEISNRKTFSSKDIVLVPVPLHRSRERERGFNQIEKVLFALPIEFQNGELSRIESNALIRTRATSPQTRLSRGERLKNVIGAFAVTDPHVFANSHIILIDDVTTTGATLTEAARSFQNVPMLLALARA